MIKYTEISDLNNDQVAVIKKNGWCLFTECDEGGSYYRKGLAWVNRIGYVVFSENVEQEDIDSYKELCEIASYDDEFATQVREQLEPIRDECYIFLVKNPARYDFEQVWTNGGLERAKEIAATRFNFEHQYYESKDYDEMREIIWKYNKNRGVA